jgi:hypothetical protein
MKMSGVMHFLPRMTQSGIAAAKTEGLSRIVVCLESHRSLIIG